MRDNENGSEIDEFGCQSRIDVTVKFGSDENGSRVDEFVSPSWIEGAVKFEFVKTRGVAKNIITNIFNIIKLFSIIQVGVN